MRALIVIVALALATPAAAEPTPLRWPSHRDLAARLSDGFVVTAIAADTIASWRSDHRGRAFGCQAIRLGATLGVTEITKRLVHRERPDGSDWKSFWSGHTATAMASSGWRYEVGVPIAIGAGYFRMAADKHYMTDVAVGAGVGLLASRICKS